MIINVTMEKNQTSFKNNYKDILNLYPIVMNFHESFSPQQDNSSSFEITQKNHFYTEH